METAAAAASAERTGGPGATAAASERLAHALVAVGLLIGRAGLAGGGGESGDARARAALRNRAADALVPALGSRSGAARDLAASVAAATVGWGGWSAEHAALLDGSLAALGDASESESAGSGAGVASLAAALVAAEPFASPGFGGTRPGLARVLRTCERGRTEDARVGALAVIRIVLETAAPGKDVVAGSEAAAIAAASLGALKDPTLIVRRAAAATFSALRIGDVLPASSARYPRRTRANAPPRGRARRAPCERTRKPAGRARLWTRSSPPCDLDRGRSTTRATVTATGSAGSAATMRTTPRVLHRARRPSSAGGPKASRRIRRARSPRASPPRRFVTRA